MALRVSKATLLAEETFGHFWEDVQADYELELKLKPVLKTQAYARGFTARVERPCCRCNKLVMRAKMIPSSDECKHLACLDCVRTRTTGDSDERSELGLGELFSLSDFLCPKCTLHGHVRAISPKTLAAYVSSAKFNAYHDNLGSLALRIESELEADVPAISKSIQESHSSALTQAGLVASTSKLFKVLNRLRSFGATFAIKIEPHYVQLNPHSRFAGCHFNWALSYPCNSGPRQVNFRSIVTNGTHEWQSSNSHTRVKMTQGRAGLIYLDEHECNSESGSGHRSAVSTGRPTYVGLFAHSRHSKIAVPMRSFPVEIERDCVDISTGATTATRCRLIGIHVLPLGSDHAASALAGQRATTIPSVTQNQQDVIVTACSRVRVWAALRIQRFIKEKLFNLVQDCPICRSGVKYVSMQSLLVPRSGPDGRKKKSSNKNRQFWHCLRDHRACAECNHAYVNQKVTDLAIDIACMWPGCKLIMSDEHINHYVKGASYKERVDAGIKMRQRNIVTMWAKAATSNKSQDGEPANLNLKDSDSNETCAFLQNENNTKVCPHCYSIIYRFAGCDDMSCKCGKRFNFGDPDLTVKAIGKKLSLEGVLPCDAQHKMSFLR